MRSSEFATTMSSSSSSLNVQASWGDEDFELPDVCGNPGVPLVPLPLPSVTLVAQRRTYRNRMWNLLLRRRICMIVI